MAIWAHSGTTLHELFSLGKLTAVAIVEAFLERIDTFDGEIGAFTKILRDESLYQARDQDARLAKGEALGRLAGVPIAIKDLLHVANCETTCGSHAMREYLAPFDATAIEHLRAEDAIFIGKTNLDAFGMGSLTQNSDLQATRNPWNRALSPGGSSGGSAAAVAARMCPIALGSDTGGSIRQPASYCGIFGFKPSYGRVSRYGMVAYASSLDQIGPMAHSGEDLPLIFEIISRPCARDATYRRHKNRDLNGGQVLIHPRIGYFPKFSSDLEAPALENFRTNLEAFRREGAELVEVDLSALRHALATYYIIASAEASTNLARFDAVRYGSRIGDEQSAELMSIRSRSSTLGAEVQRRILMGTFVLSAGHKEAFYDKAQRVRTQIAECLTRAFTTCDVLAMPSAPSTAPPLNAPRDPLKEYLLDIFTTPSNLAGLPAMNIPAGFSKEGAPWGLQLIANRDKDASLLALGHHLVQVLERKHPVLRAPYFEELLAREAGEYRDAT